MEKIKTYLLIAWALLTGLFYVLLQSKNRKIEKQQDEIKSKEQQIKTKEFINNENNKTIINKDNASSMSDDDVTSLFKQNKWFDD